MSSDTSNSEPEDSDAWVRTKEKLTIQQSLINSSARTLQRLEESVSRLISISNVNGLTNGDTQSAIDDDIRLQENKVMKGFSNQLIEKHRYLKYFMEEYEGPSWHLSLEKIKSEFDRLINLKTFLKVAGLQPASIKVLLEMEENLTLDLLFSMLNPDLEQLLARCCVDTAEGKKLLSALDLLTTYYEMWERGEKPSAASRLGSTSSSANRLHSISNLATLDHLDSRSDSISSSTSAGTSPLPLHFPTSTPIPLTPSSSQSLLSPSSPFTMALASSTPQSTFASHQATAHMIPVQTPPPPPHGLNRSYSSSSSVVLSESETPPPHARGHASISCLSNGHRVGVADGEGPPRRKPPLTHKRSLSNPLANIVLNQDEENLMTPPQDPAQNSAHHPTATSRSSLACYSYRSPSPPSRAGSHPSIVSSNTGGGGSPHGRHPQMRRISNYSPAFSQSISNDQLVGRTGMATTGANDSISGSESALSQHRGNWQACVSPRCNSMAGMSRQNYSSSSETRPSDLTASSMVDLPVGLYNGSSVEHLDRVEEGNLQNSAGKSQSVPRLTLLSVSMENEKGAPTGSNPTSPRTPGTCTPTRHMRHTIRHRFSTKAFITPHICDYCKKTVMMGVRCKDCKYKCHKTCAAKAPASCGLPQELMNYFRKHISMTSSLERLADQRVESAVQSPSERSTPRPPMERSNTYDLDTRDPGFLIQDLASEPTNFHYSPILDGKRGRAETTNGVISRHELSSQSSSTSLLEVPHTHMPRAYRSTSSSPSLSPPTSPSLTPSSPRSPSEYYPSGYYNYPLSSQRYHVAQRVHVKQRNEDSDPYTTESEEGSVYSSQYSSTNDVSDQSRVAVDTPQGTRPGPQIILAKSLPDLLALSPTETDLDKSCSRFLEKPREQGGREEGGVAMLRPAAARRVSMDSHGYHHGKIRRKESLQRTLSTADSKASTLVATEEDDIDSDSYSQDMEEWNGDYKPGRSLQHRNSVVDEWSIPFDSIRMAETIGRGRISKVSRGYWHGDVAIKHFYTPNATDDEVLKFKEEVSVLKKTRHENLALFMGASLVPPNLAIVTIFCRGPSLHKCIHTWSEPFALEKSIDLAKQVSQAMGYLHARYIVHKNLNTRNIFLENDKNKVVISDTGLSSLSNSLWIERDSLVIRKNKLYYLAPELTRTLRYFPASNTNALFEHSEETDIYAFGTVLFELMMRKFPFSSDQYGFSIPPAALIHLIGNGYRPEMHSRETPKRMQDLIYSCQHLDPEQRLPFKTIHEALVKMSRKKMPITRSPSFPISLSKSTEGLNFLNP